MKEIKIIDNAEFGNAVRDEILAEALEEERKIREQNDLVIVRDYNKDFAHSFDFEHEPDTGKITIRLRDKNGDILDSKEIDLETEWIIKYAQIDLVAKVITFWGDHDQYKFECDISDLLDGIDEKIEKLDDRIDDVCEALGDEEDRAMTAEQKLADDLHDFKDNEFAEAVDQILALSDGLTAETTARAEADEALNEKIDDTKADLEDKIDADCKALDEKIDATEEALTETISNAVEELDEKIDAGWALFNDEFMPRLDTRLGGIDDRIDGVDKRLDDRDTELNNKISELEDEDSELEGKITSLKGDVETADEKLADDIAAVDEKTDDLDEKIDEEIENVTAKFADYLPLAGGKMTGKLELGNNALELSDKASIEGTEEGQVIIDTGDTGYGLKIMSNSKAYVEIKANLEDEHYLIYSGVGDHPACTLKLPEITATGEIDTIALESEVNAALSAKADLDEDGKVKAEQLPDWVDDVIEFYGFTTSATLDTAKVYFDRRTGSTQYKFITYKDGEWKAIASPVRGKLYARATGVTADRLIYIKKTSNDDLEEISRGLELSEKAAAATDAEATKAYKAKFGAQNARDIASLSSRMSIAEADVGNLDQKVDQVTEGDYAFLQIKIGNTMLTEDKLIKLLALIDQLDEETDTSAQ